MYTLLERMLVADEGYRKHPYEDTEHKLTIGVGRNLDDVGLRDDEIKLMLANDVKVVRDQLIHVDWYRNLNEPRQHVIENMVFNLGWPKFMGFKKTIAFIIQRRYADAADEMLRSKWASQVKDRALRLASIMRNGEFGNEY